MGGFQSSSQIQIHRQKFYHMFRNNYRFSQKIKSQIFGQISLFANKNTNKVQIMLKQVSYTQANQVQHILNTLQDRIKHPQPNLITIYNVSLQTIDGICGNYKAILIYAEYLDRSLLKQLRKRRTTKSYYFNEDQLWRILKSLINAINYLHSRKTFHGQIRFQNIMVDGDYHMKLTERTLMNNQNWQVGMSGNSVKMLKGKGILFSPGILRCLQHNTMQMVSYDPFKGDIFALGIIMLECASLKKAEDFYDYQHFQVNSKEINTTIYETRKKYSWQLVNTIQKMLQQQDQFRYSASQVYENIKNKGNDKLNITMNASLLQSARR